jgi:hypothetical protein
VSVRCLFCEGEGFVGSVAEGRQWFEAHRSREHPELAGALHVEALESDKEAGDAANA